MARSTLWEHASPTQGVGAAILDCCYGQPPIDYFSDDYLVSLLCDLKVGKDSVRHLLPWLKNILVLNVLTHEKVYQVASKFITICADSLIWLDSALEFLDYLVTMRHTSEEYEKSIKMMEMYVITPFSNRMPHVARKRSRKLGAHFSNKNEWNVCLLFGVLNGETMLPNSLYVDQEVWATYFRRNLINKGSSLFGKEFTDREMARLFDVKWMTEFLNTIPTNRQIGVIEYLKGDIIVDIGEKLVDD